MRVLTTFSALLLLGACAIDFVAVEDPSEATSIQVVTVHTETLRATVEIFHRGKAAPRVRVNGQTRLMDVDPARAGQYSSLFDLVIDPASPVLDVEVEQLQTRNTTIRLDLMTKGGEATCETDGDLLIPLIFEAPSLGDAFNSWRVGLAGADGRWLSEMQAMGAQPDPLIVPASLLTDSVTTADVRIDARGTVAGSPVDIAVRLLGTASWALSGACPMG